jgi:hypothetical protein
MIMHMLAVNKPTTATAAPWLPTCVRSLCIAVGIALAGLAWAADEPAIEDAEDDRAPAADAKAAAETAACVETWQAKGLQPGVDFSPGRLLVGFARGTAREVAQAVLGDTCPITRYNAGTGGAFITVPAGKEFEELCRLKRRAEVRYAELDAKVHAQAVAK